MSLTRCLQSCATERTTEPDIAETERVRTRLVDLMAPHLWTAVCMSQATERLSTISMYWLCSILCCLCQCCTHNSSSFLVTHFAHFHTTHLLNPSTQLLFTPSTQLLFFLPLHTRSGASTTETELSGTRVGGSPTAYPTIILRRRYIQHVSRSRRYTHSWQAEVVHRSNCGMDNVAIHVQGVRVCSA